MKILDIRNDHAARLSFLGNYDAHYQDRLQGMEEISNERKVEMNVGQDASRALAGSTPASNPG